MNYLKDKKDLKEFLKYEKGIYSGKGMFIPVLITETQVLRRHCVLLRKTEYYHNTGRKIRELFYRIRLYRLQNRYSLHIPINTCDKGLSIAHVGPIVINGDSRIGKNCRIHVGVNIGANGGKSPVLGDDIYIGPGAKIFGDINIADGCKIGANAVVNKSCDIKCATLVGVPAKVLTKEK